MKGKLAINWQYFSLEQVNNKEGPQWKIWEQPEDYPSRGLRAFQAAEAARMQGEAAFDSFHTTLLQARHERRQNIADVSILMEVAKSTGLEMARFQKDLGNRKLLARLIENHTHAAETLGIFGTPTLVFPDEQAVFLKMSPPPPLGESVSIFNELYQIAEQRRNIHEIKRPNRPARDS